MASRLDLWLLPLLVFAIAVLYSSVGQAGASGYLAAMALLGLAPAVMKPAALVLNIVVAAVTSLRFYRAKCFSWSHFWPFAVTSVPFSFLGGRIALPGKTYHTIVGIILIYAAVRLIQAGRGAREVAARLDPRLALAAGAAIGLVSGLIGIGGGIFLSPLLVLMGWSTPRTASAVSAVFILVNSLAGLLGNFANAAWLPGALPLWAAAALAGGWVGSELGSRHLKADTIRRLLAVILVIAGLRMLLP